MNAAELIARQIYRLIPHGRSVALSEILNTESMTPVQAKEAMDEVLAGLRWLIEMSLIIDIGYGYYRRTEVLEYSSKEI